MTPLELIWAVEGRSEFHNFLYESMVTAGWLSAALERQKRIPPLEKLLKCKRRVKSNEEARKEFEELKREFADG